MKKHAKLIALFLSVALTAVLFTVAVSAIATPDEATPDEIVPVTSLPVPEIGDVLEPVPEEEQSVTEIPDDASRPKTEAGIVIDEAFEIIADAHMYGEEKLLLVTVDNVSDTAYSIDVTVSYLDAESGVIATETQSFDQLASDYTQNFVFRPGYDFADYRLETVKTAYKGECWKSKVTFSYVETTFGYGDYHHDYPNGMGEYDFEKGGYVDRFGNIIDHYSAYQTHPTYHVQNNSGRDVVATSVTMIVFDDKGEIYDVLERGGEVRLGTDSSLNYKSFPTVYAFRAGDAAAEAEMRTIKNSTGFVAGTVILSEDSEYCS